MTDKAILEEVDRLRNQLSFSEERRQCEERCRLMAEAKLEVFKQDVLPFMAQLITGPRYHLEHVQAGQIGEIVHGRHFQAGETTVNNGPELDDIRKLLDNIKERQNEIQANNATAEDIEEFYSAVASIRAQLDVSRSDRSTLQKAIRVIQRIAEKTGTSGLAELAKQAASSLFETVSPYGL